MIFNWLFGKKERDAKFAEWIRGGAKQKHDGLLAALNGPTMSMGIISVPSGKMAIQDPSDELVDPCFDEYVTAGDYPVDAVVVSKDDDHRIAAVRVKVGDGEISHLEPAWTSHWRALSAKRQELPWISVDSAMAAVFSLESLLEFQNLDLDKVDVGPNLDGKAEELFKETKFDDGTNMFIMQAGYGDGGYNCYWAKTQDRKPVALLVDFGFFGKPSKIGFD